MCSGWRIETRRKNVGHESGVHYFNGNWAVASMARLITHPVTVSIAGTSHYLVSFRRESFNEIHD
jgi:hypothetical protein